MTGGGRGRLAGVVLLVEEGLEGGDDDEFAVALDQALDELGPPAHADAGRSLGVGAGQVVTSWTLSVRRPTRVGSPSRSISMTTMRLSMVGSPRSMAKATRRSDKGMTLPRKLITAPAKAPAPGTTVSGARSMISCTATASRANSSPFSSKVRTSICSAPVQPVVSAVSLIPPHASAPPAAGPWRPGGPRPGSGRRRRRPGWWPPRRSAGPNEAWTST